MGGEGEEKDTSNFRGTNTIGSRMCCARLLSAEKAKAWLFSSEASRSPRCCCTHHQVAALAWSLCGPRPAAEAEVLAAPVLLAAGPALHPILKTCRAVERLGRIRARGPAFHRRGRRRRLQRRRRLRLLRAQPRIHIQDVAVLVRALQPVPHSGRASDAWRAQWHLHPYCRARGYRGCCARGRHRRRRARRRTRGDGGTCQTCGHRRHRGHRPGERAHRERQRLGRSCG
mmetsp:Transcript_100185/g.264605  ORF Transcript_100185/g.264605 Transcript_100185/m.264605 type:complete len:229 (+) Transcript_100185:292-978(+)